MPCAESLQLSSITICFHYAAGKTSPDGKMEDDSGIDCVCSQVKSSKQQNRVWISDCRLNWDLRWRKFTLIAVCDFPAIKQSRGLQESNSSPFSWQRCVPLCMDSNTIIFFQETIKSFIQIKAGLRYQKLQFLWWPLEADAKKWVKSSNNSNLKHFQQITYDFVSTVKFSIHDCTNVNYVTKSWTY